MNKGEDYFRVIALLCALDFIICNLMPDGLDSLSLITTQTWRDYGGYKNYTNKQSAAAFLITFRSKNSLRLKNLEVLWSGPRLERLSATLYKKHKETTNMIPIQENFVADGVWNVPEQKILFQLNEKIVAISTFFLVINFPAESKELMQAGHFSLNNLAHR